MNAILKAVLLLSIFTLSACATDYADYRDTGRHDGSGETWQDRAFSRHSGSGPANLNKEATSDILAGGL